MSRGQRQARMSTAIEQFALQLPALDRVTRVDQVGVEERVARFCTRSIKKESEDPRADARAQHDRPDDARGAGHARQGDALCRKAVHLHASDRPAARRRGVRLPDDGPRRSPRARRARHQGRLGGYRVPERHGPARDQARETRIAVDEGADEIDMVIARGAFLQGDYQRVFDEIVPSRRRAAPRTSR